jgi:hypothetical protein
MGGNSGDAVGSVQDDNFKEHNHPVTPYLPTGGNALSGNITPVTDFPTPITQTGLRGGNETRPVNANVTYVIKVV